MTHQSENTILHSLLDTFDPASTHYQGVREHFSDYELMRIDELRAQQSGYDFTLADRVFISYCLTKVVMTASNG